jgi:hypothetical protein
VLRKIFGPNRDEVRRVERTAQRGAECFVLFAKYNYNYNYENQEG